MSRRISGQRQRAGGGGRIGGGGTRPVDLGQRFFQHLDRAADAQHHLVELGLLAFEFTRLGIEKVTTPAGIFDAMHYQLAGTEALDMWVAGEDKLLVRQTDTKNDREYILTEMAITPTR